MPLCVLMSVSDYPIIQITCHQTHLKNYLEVERKYNPLAPKSNLTFKHDLSLIALEAFLKRKDKHTWFDLLLKCNDAHIYYNCG